MSDPVVSESASGLGRVDEVCRNFEAAWKSHLADRSGAARPRVEDYAESLPEADRPLLERELRAVDAAYARRLATETLPPDPRPAGEDGRGDAEPIRVRYFGDYELLEKIASGGFGVVYKARQVSLNRVVALKMIGDGRLATPELVQRFRLEAEAAAGLEHEGIVPVYEVGAHDGQHYFSMKLIEGGSLTAHVERYVKDPRAAAALMAQVARAVHHAHQRGVLHRDLKPGNILLDAKGQPHVTDFGLAKLLASGPRTEGRPETLSGAVLGTPGYIAPEQARGQKGVTTAADVYGLGAVLYELLTGRPPFRADTPLDALVQVLEREPARPRSLDARVDRDLETVCLKCLEKEPAQRYGTAEAVAEELERWLRGMPILARPAGQAERLWRWCRRNPLVAGLSAAVVLSLMAGTVTSTLFAFRAESEAELARKRESETAVERDRAQEALADGLLRPLGIGQKGEDVNVFEWQALADLASLPPEQARVRTLFIEQALGNERKAGQLSRRLEPALQAAVGTDPETHRRVIDLAEGAVRDEGRPLSVRLVAARAMVDLDGEEADPRQQVMSILLQGLFNPGDSTVSDNVRANIRREALKAIRRIAGRASPEAGTAAARQALELVPKADADQLQALSGAVAAVAKTGDPEATRVAATAVTRRALELVPKAERYQTQRLSDVVAAVAGRMDREAATAVTRQARELVPKADTYQLQALSGVVAVVAEKGDPEAARAAATAITRRTVELVPKADADQLQALSRAVAAVAEKGNPEITRAPATAVTREGLGLIPKADSYHELGALSEVVAAVAEKGDPQDTRAAAAAVTRRVCELLFKTDRGYEPWGPPDVASVARLLDREASAAVTRQALEFVPKAAAGELEALWRVVALVAEKGGPQAIRAAATVFAHRILELLPKSEGYELGRLSGVVAAVAEKADPEATRAAAAAVARRVLELRPKDEAGRLVAQSFSAAVAGRLDRDTAAAVARQALELATKADTDQLEWLFRAAAVEETGGPKATRAAAAVARRALELAPKADVDHLWELSGAVAAVAEKGDSEATRAAAAVARRALELMPTADVDRTWALVLAVHAVQDRVEWTPQPEAAAELGRRLLLGSFSERKVSAAVLDWLLHGASVEALVDLLKHPVCVGLMREAVLRELGRQHERPFRSVWDAVAWLQQHRPDIDLTSPPRLRRDPPPGR